jgi:hypothetical protein
MRLALCEGEALRLCASCARNVENATQRPRADQVDPRPYLNPNTRGERCLDWYPLPPTPKPATPAP